MKPSANYKNPMEWVGEVHNQSVNFILREMQRDTKNKPTEKFVRKHVTDYFGSVGVTCEKIPRYKNTLNVNKTLEGMKKNGVITNDCFEDIIELFNIIQKNEPLSKVLVEIDMQEHAAAKKLHGPDLLHYQGLNAVIRHSAKLWAPVNEGGEDLGHKLLGVTKKVNWGEVACADGCGFEEGGIVGAVLFSVINIRIQVGK